MKKRIGIIVLGMILGGMCADFAWAQQPQDLVINEIHYNPPGADDLEFVELYNRSGQTYDLRDFRFKDDTQTTRVITNTSILLPPNGYAVLVKDTNLFAASYPNVAVIQPPSWPSLNNTDEVVTLLWDQTVIDQVAYSASWGGTDVSLERIDPNGASSLRTNWASCTDAARATPGRVNSVYHPDVTPPKPLIARQTGVQAVQVVFNEPLQAASVTVQRFTLDGVPPSQVSLSADGTVVTLVFGTVGGEVLRMEGLLDLARNVMGVLSLALAYQPQAGDLVVNEILADPKADTHDQLPDQPELMELLNRTSRTLDLTGLFWTDAPDETGKADTLRVPAGDWAIGANGYVVISAEGTMPTSAAESKLVKAFPDADFSTGTRLLIPMPRTTLSLDNDGDTIRLHRADRTLLDAVTYTSAWHHPNLSDATGVSLERISPDAPSQDAQNWGSSVHVAGATPARLNSLFTTGSPVEMGRIEASPSPFSPDGDGRDEVTGIQYHLTAAVALLRVRVFDRAGRLVRTISHATLGASEGQVFWNGLDDAGNRVPVGIYVVFLDAVDGAHGVAEAYKTAVVVARAF